MRQEVTKLDVRQYGLSKTDMDREGTPRVTFTGEEGRREKERGMKLNYRTNSITALLSGHFCALCKLVTQGLRRLTV